MAFRERAVTPAPAAKWRDSGRHCGPGWRRHGHGHGHGRSPVRLQHPADCHRMARVGRLDRVSKQPHRLRKSVSWIPSTHRGSDHESVVAAHLGRKAEPVGVPATRPFQDWACPRPPSAPRAFTAWRCRRTPLTSPRSIPRPSASGILGSRGHQDGRGDHRPRDARVQRPWRRPDHRAGHRDCGPCANVDLARDPRWGRVEESYGEDPYLIGELAKTFVAGLQGTDAKYLQVASLLKHFMANSNENTRVTSSSNLDDRNLREYYAATFATAIRSAHAQGMMTAYNKINGVAAAATPLLKSMVIGEWGFDGIICTDGGAPGLLAPPTQTYFPTVEQAVATIIKAGTGTLLQGTTTMPLATTLTNAATMGLYTDADVDAVLRPVLRVRFRLGDFDPPALVPYKRILGTETPWTTRRGQGQRARRDPQDGGAAQEREPRPAAGSDHDSQRGRDRSAGRLGRCATGTAASRPTS